MKEERFLPIGTVVLLDGATKPIMINGFCAVTKDMPDKTFDYRGCPWPEGVLLDSGVALFDHDQVKEILHIGYKTPESIDMSDRLEIILEKMQDTEK